MKKNFFLILLSLISIASYSQVSSEELAVDPHFIVYDTTMHQMAELLRTKFTEEEFE